MINVEAKSVHCQVKNSIPKDDETIATDFDIEKIIESLKSIEYYLRDPKDCPYARGNWILDLTFINGQIFCIKLPREMKKEKFESWVKPLVEKFNDKRKSICH